jgi:eukaryotic-like serine/threonine-protein kinase
MNNPGIDVDSSNLPAGYMFVDRYEVIQQLGTGAMGAVYLVKDSLLDGAERALKILHADLTRDEMVTKRFLREAQLMQTVSHPNVVRVFEVAHQGGLLYFTMEFVRGKPLDDLIAQKALKKDKLYNFILQLCEGLDAIHASDIIHRDLKPANILILDNGSVKITDFGVARPGSSNLTAHKEILGTPQYMAPEIIQGHDLTASVDLYSLGIILFEVCTGEVPFLHESAAQLMWMQVRRAPAQPKDINPAVPQWLNDLIGRLLAKTANDRPRTVREVINIVKMQLERKGSPEVTTATGESARAAVVPTKISTDERAQIADALTRTTAAPKRNRGNKLAVSVPLILMLVAVVMIFLFAVFSMIGYFQELIGL